MHNVLRRFSGKYGQAYANVLKLLIVSDMIGHHTLAIMKHHHTRSHHNYGPHAEGPYDEQEQNKYCSRRPKKGNMINYMRPSSLRRAI
ncbi:hypothetical protein ACJX0J_031769 [Zea mays]